MSHYKKHIKKNSSSMSDQNNFLTDDEEITAVRHTLTLKLHRDY